MITIQLEEQTCELGYVVAALSRVKEPGNLQLFERLFDTMDAQEMAYYHELRTTMEFTSVEHARLNP
jgi:hypothetical protein